MFRHLKQDFRHNGRHCDTTEVLSIREAIRLHIARGWIVRDMTRNRMYGTSLFTVTFDWPGGRETSTLAFRFSPRHLF